MHQLKSILDNLSFDLFGLRNLDYNLESKPDFGDLSTNLAFVIAGKKNDSPKKIAQKIKDNLSLSIIEKIDIAGSGFINFSFSKRFFADFIQEINNQGADAGKNEELKGKKIIIEYTDANPFKEFHIGHLMSNTIGESLSRLIEFSGASVRRANYQGDIGLHVAKAIWGIKNLGIPKDEISLNKKAVFLGQAYTKGATGYENDQSVKKEIQELNKKIFKKSDPEINKLYDWGKKASMDYFEKIYHRLGTKFDYYFLESEVAESGIKMVKEGLKKGIFEKSDNAIVFRGEKYGLHTRVFINSQGLPTYEAKELGLNESKFEKEPFNLSIVITGNEIQDYFKVVLRALDFINPDISKRTKHVAHGMLRVKSGKMSSRKGNIITGMSLIYDVGERAGKKIKNKQLSQEEKEKIKEKVSLGAIKFSVLKQSPGRDIIFDPEKSLSLEGDSGPYLQYAYIRAHSVLSKARQENINSMELKNIPEISDVERFLLEFPSMVRNARTEYAPQCLAAYLIKLSSSFNTFYVKNRIVDSKDRYSGYRVALTRAFEVVIKNGLYLLGIELPDKM